MNTRFLPDGDDRIVTVHCAGYSDTSVPRLHPKDSHFLFEYVLSGEEIIESPDYLIHAGIGELIMIHPSEECVIYRDTTSVNAISIQISGFVLEALADVLGLPRVGKVYADILDKLLPVKSMFEKYSAGDSTTGRLLLELAFSLMLDMSSHNDADIYAGKPSAEKIKAYLDTCLCGDVDLDTVGKKFSISGMHVIRLFRGKYDITPMQYLKLKRIEKSAEMLAETEVGIKDISSLLRFSSTQHFTNLFREHFGISPGKFRENSK